MKLSIKIFFVSILVHSATLSARANDLFLIGENPCYSYNTTEKCWISSDEAISMAQSSPTETQKDFVFQRGKLTYESVTLPLLKKILKNFIKDNVPSPLQTSVLIVIHQYGYSDRAQLSADAIVAILGELVATLSSANEVPGLGITRENIAVVKKLLKEDDAPAADFIRFTNK